MAFHPGWNVYDSGMEIQAVDYEKLGRFYLGREYDLEAGELEDELVLYDSKDLVTHGVVLGVTGSGKTGLCIALLEEAVMDNVPAIVIPSRSPPRLWSRTTSLVYTLPAGGTGRRK